MNYYIQGDAANAEKIKAAFKELGYNTRGFDFSCGFFYTVERDIHYCVFDYMVNIIKTHPDYKELELPVEPKFKVGDWVVKKDGTTFYGGNYAEQVILIEGDEYLKRIWCSSTTWLQENDIRLWTIQDAKDGNVLVDEYTDTIGIFEETNGIYWNSKIYCAKSISTKVYHHGGSHHIKFAKPATKEQVTLFFKKMKEAGYQWDSDKKELRKIKPHYDIKNFHAGMPVLVRADNVCRWNYSVFSHITGNKDCQFAVCNGVSFTQCIPFEGNETLLGTNDMCNERFVNW